MSDANGLSAATGIRNALLIEAAAVLIILFLIGAL